MVLDLNEEIVGTGTIWEQNICRVFISPAFQGRSFGRMVMNLGYTGEIYNLHVAPAFQSQGIGRLNRQNLSFPPGIN